MRELFTGFAAGALGVLGVVLMIHGGIYMVQHNMNNGSIFLSEDQNVSLICGEAIILNEKGTMSNELLRERFEWALEHRFDCP